MTRSAAQKTGAKLPEVHGVNKPLDPDLRPEKDKGLQKHVLAQPAKIVPNGPVTTATGPAPPTPYLPRAIPQIKLPVKVAPPTPDSPPRILRPTPQIGTTLPRKILHDSPQPPMLSKVKRENIPQTPQQIRLRNLPTVTPVTVPKINTPQTSDPITGFPQIKAKQDKYKLTQ